MPDTPIDRREAAQAQQRELTEGGRPIVADKGDATYRELQAIGREHRRFLNLHSPIKASLWLALMRNADEVIASAQNLGNAAQSSDDPEEVASGTGVPPKPAIVALGEVMVAKALRGDAAFANMITERIEGKVGPRKGDVDEDELKTKRQTQLVLTQVVEMLVDAKAGKDITKHVKVLDATDENE